MKKKVLLILSIILILVIVLILFIIGYRKNEAIKNDIVTFSYETSGSTGYSKYNISENGKKIIFSYESDIFGRKDINKEIDKYYLEKLLKIVNDYNIYEWDGFDESIEGEFMDGTSFNFEIVFKDGKTIKASGYEATPDNYKEAINAIAELFSPLI